MRILYITLENLSFHKGSVVHVKEIVNGLRELGHQVGLVACSLKKSEGEKHFYNLNIIPSFMLRLLRLKKQPHIVSLFILFFTLIRILSQYDILYVREFHAVMIAFLPRLLFGKKLIFEINGLASEEQLLKGDSPLKRFSASLIKQAEKMAAKCSDRIVSVTLQIASYLIQYVHCQPDKVEVISNGVNTHKFHPIHEQSLLMPYRDRVKINRGYKVLAFVGNLARWQGVNILIESGCRLLLRDKKLRFLIVGDGPLKKNLMDRVLESGFQKEFIFTGMVDYNEIPLFINLADICVAPFISKRNEKTGVSPLKVYEYMACGKPVVASRVEGLAFLEEEGAGRLVEPEDVNDLEKALGDLLQDPGKRAAMGTTGLKIARERYSWKSKAAEIERILKDLV